jgi:hypothetical protein
MRSWRAPPDGGNLEQACRWRHDHSRERGCSAGACAGEYRREGHPHALGDDAIYVRRPVRVQRQRGPTLGTGNKAAGRPDARLSPGHRSRPQGGSEGPARRCMTVFASTPFAPPVAAPLSFHTTVRRERRRRETLFLWPSRSASLARWPDRAKTLRRLHPNSLGRCSASPGHFAAGRRSMTSPPGPSRTTGPHSCRSPKPRSTCSRPGSASFSTSCSDPVADLRRKLLP